MNPLSASRRSELRAQAHKLSPVVIIGDKGLTDEVIAEVDRSLKAHELIKVRAATDDRDARGAWMEAICAKLEAHPVQQIGKVLVIYRQNPVEAEARPKARPRADPRARDNEGAPRGKAGSARGKVIPRGKVIARGKPTPRGKFGTPRATYGTPRAQSDTPRGRFGTSRTKSDDARGKFAGARTKAGGADAGSDEVKRSVRPRSRTPSPLPESGPRRRRPRTSR